jgi:hypothetical protein
MQAGLQMLALLWVLLSCHPGHALEGRHGLPDTHSSAHAASASVSVATALPGAELSASALANGCDADALATPFRRDDHDTPDLSARPASAADLIVELHARMVPHTDSSVPSVHSLRLARPLRI